MKKGFASVFVADATRAGMTADAPRESLAAILKLDSGGYPIRVLKTSCDGCLWAHKDDASVCDAFPDGIPLPILTGAYDHRHHYEDEETSDFGLVREPDVPEGE